MYSSYIRDGTLQKGFSNTEGVILETIYDLVNIVQMFSYNAFPIPFILNFRPAITSMMVTLIPILFDV